MLVIKGQQILLRATVRKAAGPEELPQAAEPKESHLHLHKQDRSSRSGQGAAKGLCGGEAAAFFPIFSLFLFLEHVLGQ